MIISSRSMRVKSSIQWEIWNCARAKTWTHEIQLSYLQQLLATRATLDKILSFFDNNDYDGYDHSKLIFSHAAQKWNFSRQVFLFLFPLERVYGRQSRRSSSSIIQINFHQQISNICLDSKRSSSLPPSHLSLYLPLFVSLIFFLFSFLLLSHIWRLSYLSLSLSFITVTSEWLLIFYFVIVLLSLCLLPLSLIPLSFPLFLPLPPATLP